jgi:cytochrome c553
MKRRVLRAAALLVVLAAGGFLVAASGIIPVKASSGHWGITAWLLHFSMERSVSTQTLWVSEPSLDEPWLAMKGAGHYETGCRPCHGAPDLRSPRIAMAMTPHPPYLPPLIAEWEPEELFYIVKHGVKFTGMPAWPSQERDDEVRAMVAFLLRMPGLDAEAYRRLVHGEAPPAGSVAPLPDLTGPPEAPRAVLASCARCHGVHGRGREVAAFPRLAGQRRAYFVAALQAYANDERHSGIMQPIAAGLSIEEIQELADYYSRMPAGAPDAGDTPELLPALERGREIADRGVPAKGVPSCADCHGPGPGPRNSMYPVLAGQFSDYLVLQLELFKARRRGGSAYAHLMHHVADRLSAQQMRDVALYYASHPPAHDSSER